MGNALALPVKCRRPRSSDVACAGWMLKAVEERVNERNLRKVIDQASRLLPIAPPTRHRDAAGRSLCGRHPLCHGGSEPTSHDDFMGGSYSKWRLDSWGPKFRDRDRETVRETYPHHSGEGECDAVGIANGLAAAFRSGRDARRQRRYRRPHRPVVPIAQLSVPSVPLNGHHILLGLPGANPPAVSHSRS